MSDPVVPFDLARMLWGEAPPLFLLEILFRTLIVYTYALVLVRWIGARGVSQLSMVEFLLVIALGSAVGDALFYPEVPLLHALLAITLIILINKALDVAIIRWRGARRVVDGMPVRLVLNGVIDPGARRQHALGDREVMTMLRNEGVRNLGEVGAAYLEPNGKLSLFRHDPPRPGLRIEPPHELEPPPPALSGESALCASCGLDVPETDAKCPNCGCRQFTPAQI